MLDNTTKDYYNSLIVTRYVLSGIFFSLLCLQFPIVILQFVLYAMAVSTSMINMISVLMLLMLMMTCSVLQNMIRNRLLVELGKIKKDQD